MLLKLLVTAYSFCYFAAGHRENVENVGEITPVPSARDFQPIRAAVSVAISFDIRMNLHTNNIQEIGSDQVHLSLHCKKPRALHVTGTNEEQT